MFFREKFNKKRFSKNSVSFRNIKINCRFAVDDVIPLKQGLKHKMNPSMAGKPVC